jgi:hypothetical protein
LTLAILPLVERMHFVMTATVLLPADVFLNTLETLMWPVGLSAPPTQSVPQIGHAGISSALTLALDCVELMLSAK